MNNRRVAALVLAAALLVPALVGATKLAGWGTGSGGGGGSDAKADQQALREFAGHLAAGRDRTFTAWYTTGSGVVVTSAQAPPRRGYRSAAGVYVAGPDATYLCRTPAGERPACSVAAGVDEVPMGHARELAGVLDGDFIAPELVTMYLSRLSAREPGRVVRTQRVIAGQPVGCIAVADLFSACATAEGLLASFEAAEGRLTLTRYEQATAAEAFALPRNATMAGTTP